MHKPKYIEAVKIINDAKDISAFSEAPEWLRRLVVSGYIEYCCKTPKNGDTLWHVGAEGGAGIGDYIVLYSSHDLAVYN
jgi:hypothetical protein